MFAHPSSFFRLDTIVHAVTSGCDIGMPLSVGQHAASVAQAAPAGTGAAGAAGAGGGDPAGMSTWIWMCAVAGEMRGLAFLLLCAACSPTPDDQPNAHPPSTCPSLASAASLASLASLNLVRIL